MKKKKCLYKIYDKNRKENAIYHAWYIFQDGILIKKRRIILKDEFYIQYHEIIDIEITNFKDDYIINLKLNSLKINDKIVISKDSEKEYFKEGIKYIQNKGVNIKMIGFNDDYFYNDFDI